MYNLDIIKVGKEEYPNIFEENVDKYLMIDNSKNIIGISSINNNVEKNKIEVHIEEKYRSNGYGKKLFNNTVSEYVKKFGYDKLVFEINERNYRFISIIVQAGSIQINHKDEKDTYVLPLMKWRETYDRS